MPAALRRSLLPPILLLLAPLAVGAPGHSAARADDWPQWMGPARDGVWRERGLVGTIPAGGLPVKWRAEVKGGYSGPAVAAGRVYLMDYDRRSGDLANDPGTRTALAGRERILCLDATTGRLLWKHEYDRDYSMSYASGPRCTPTVFDGMVHALGAEGHAADPRAVLDEIHRDMPPAATDRARRLLERDARRGEDRPPVALAEGGEPLGLRHRLEREAGGGRLAV